MCGFSSFYGEMPENFIEDGFSIRYRGPDNTVFRQINKKVGMLFHRLAIVGLGKLAEQPLELGNKYLVCNGEIYNHKELFEKNGFKNNSGSDCEIILHLYEKYGIESALQQLDGVFAFTLYDGDKDLFYVARDPFGIRPAFYGSANGTLCVASEGKAIHRSCDEVFHVLPGTYFSYSDTDGKGKGFGPVTRYYDLESKINVLPRNRGEVLRDIRWSLVKAVEKRLFAEREFGCLLSGGLDSSLVAALVAKMAGGHRLVRGKDQDDWEHFEGLKLPYNIKTFSIGMEGSPDLEYADKAAKHIGSDHHRVQLTEGEFLSAVENTIWRTESYDTTTIRASVGNHLISKYVSENSDCKVIFNGDGADEVCCGYAYNSKAPSDNDLQEESLRLVSEIFYFDVLRSDRSISSNGLEARTPFLDKHFVETYMSIDPSLKSFGKDGMAEKSLLREAFEGDSLLPTEILWRDKCAFSDGVSSVKRSWHKTLQANIDELISDDEFELHKKKIKNCKPDLKESLYYRQVFAKLFGPTMSEIIPHFWLPRWTNTKDPSARELDSDKE